MLLESVILAVLIGFLAGGKLNPLIDVQLKKVSLLAIGVLLQVLAYWSVKADLNFGAAWLIPALHSLSYLPLIAFAWLNRSHSGLSIAAVGIVLNALVISLNGGLMPVEPIYLPENDLLLLQAGTGTHGLLTESTRIKFLADVFYLSIPGLGKQLFSLGDVIIDLGIGIFIVKQMRFSKMSNIKND